MHPALTSFKGDMMNAPAQSLTNHLFHQMKIGDHASLSRHVGPEDIELFNFVDTAEEGWKLVAEHYDLPPEFHGQSNPA